MTEEQADFIAALPNVFCDLQYAVKAHSFLQRVAEVDHQFAEDAIRLGVSLGFVETDGNGKVRLASALQIERDAFKESEGYAEVAAAELADLLRQRARSTGCH